MFVSKMREIRALKVRVAELERNQVQLEKAVSNALAVIQKRFDAVVDAVAEDLGYETAKDVTWGLPLSPRVLKVKSTPDTVIRTKQVVTKKVPA